MKESLERISEWLLTVCIPILIAVSVIRVLLTPAFIHLEYRMPYFPDDKYGFSFQERMRFAQETRRYLVSRQGVSLLEELRFPDGEPLFIDREIQHLVDVKNVLQGTFSVWWAAAFAAALSGGLLFWSGKSYQLLRAVSRGGWLTAGLIVFVLVLSLLSFNYLFTTFHQLFFEGDSWLFRFSDSLIRLFPIRFWQDVFLLFGLLTLIMGAALGWLLPRLNPAEK